MLLRFLCGLLLVCLARAAAPPAFPPVTSPPESLFDMVRESDRDAARAFYRKYLDVAGLPVLAAEEVADEALHRTHTMVTGMLAGRPDVLDAMVRNRMYLIIIGKDQVYTDMPEYRNHPNPAYQNERVRGTGGRPTSFGEENLLSLPIDRYDDESIGVHEFCHTIDSTLRSLDPTWTRRRSAAFQASIDRGLWKNTYAASNPGEFWAEICQSYFDCNRVNNWNHGPIGTREQLKDYDPESYDLVRTTFRLRPDQDWRYTFFRKLPNVGPPPANLNLHPHYTRFTWAREFSVLGREAGDAALLMANDTIRKMFAHRHDLLKTLIADGVKLAVLARHERISDLPEIRSLNSPGEIDALRRILHYSPRTKLLVVGEENVLVNPNDPTVGDHQVIRLLADAIYQVAATRPVDPNWDQRGRAVQQYELRVQRLDVRFAEKLRTLHERAVANGKWRGADAIRDPVAYWIAGVLAYFDAAGQSRRPDDAPHPIRTRETLAVYDPDLHALVEQTMAYAGKVDWRFRPHEP